jgi:serine/threonine protein kinase|tara:strand:- start:613 stop:1665 length:1053 start_codon:yes stop_codon:yes gene_type:complete
MPKHNILGEGTYGCVIKPSLKCKTRKNYKNRLAKIMRGDDAEKELLDMEMLSRIKGIEKYIVRVPLICDPKDDVVFQDNLNKCQNERIKQVPVKDLKLLLVDDGGVDLDHFYQHMIPYISKKDLCIFLKSIVITIESLYFLRKKGIIHHDIKSGNIVYNIRTGKMKLIDFGLVMYRRDFLERSRKSINTLARSWSYFPKETSCLNYEKFKKCADYNKMDYDTFLNTAANTFDGYCFGSCMKRLFTKMYHDKKINLNINKRFFAEAYHLMSQICTKDLMLREQNYLFVKQRYRDLLKKYGLYSSNAIPSPTVHVRSISDKFSVVNIMVKKDKAMRDRYQTNSSTRKRKNEQ